MPIEIKELHIRVAVSDAPPDSERGGVASRRIQRAGGEDQTQRHDDIVSACVDQVMQILQAKKER